MKKAMLLFFVLVLARAYANQPVFDKQYYQCENKWVLLPKKADEKSYSAGIIYLDRTAGFTFKSEGSVEIDDKGNYKHIATDDATYMIMRIPERCVAMALIPDDKIKQMNLDTRLEWLDIYRSGENDIDQIVRRGWYFNHVGGSEQAIPILLQGYKKNPHYEGLEFELAYAYNATGKFAEAEKILQTALKNDPKNYMFMRELGYAYFNMDRVADAEKIYTKAISISDNDDQKTEMAFNMTAIYFEKGKEADFQKWLKITKKYISDGSPFAKHLKEMETNFIKK